MAAREQEQLSGKMVRVHYGATKCPLDKSLEGLLPGSLVQYLQSVKQLYHLIPKQLSIDTVKRWGII